MGWKARVRKLAEQSPEAVPGHLLAEIDTEKAQVWPKIQPHAGRSLAVGLVLTSLTIVVTYISSLQYQSSIAPYYFLAISSLVLAPLFCLLGESVVEDGVKSVVILITGCILASQLPLNWCLVPGLAAVIASIANWTLQATLGRHF